MQKLLARESVPGPAGPPGVKGQYRGPCLSLPGGGGSAQAPHRPAEPGCPVPGPASALCGEGCMGLMIWLPTILAPRPKGL